MKEHIYQDAGTRDPPGTDRPHQGTASWRPEGQPGLVMTREQMAEYIPSTRTARVRNRPRKAHRWTVES